MKYDLTTQVDQCLIEQWLSTQENRHIATGHVGTHLDTYEKSVIPLDYITCPGILLDVSDIAEDREISLSDIENIHIPEHAFLFIYTGRSEKEKYGTADYFRDHPQLSHELIQWLTNQPLRFLGIDCSGIRRGKEHEPADRLLEKNGIYVIENLSGLNQLLDIDVFIVYTLWFDDPVATGLQCKVVVDTEF
ncbi:Putative cyclase [Lacrimispora sphenoides]|jgi:kynurenine formamidase|uniref:cyclase family protein n=1 Tax=Lacrimispora sphenoides TaxID=29370 RepID=UPI0008B3A438|nr:cyclase family protein [Lacrimispora sphenoides]SET58211.1 Putative cyclase [Lacrimispora sphenoides]